ncbi:hypothetical protein FOB64_006152 [Candida albicans]|uniref:Uncharacterized protein n=2 Tax=Candida albicans TaxID=5476 RepID=A0A8H6BT35_CANAX|nr:hypothetical protein FOB64_006152 [Candida albicans]
MKLPSLSIIVPIITLGFSQLALCLPSSSDTTTSDEIDNQYIKTKRDENTVNSIVSLLQSVEQSGLIPDIVLDITSSQTKMDNLANYTVGLLSTIMNGNTSSLLSGINIDLNTTEILNAVLNSGLLQSTAGGLILNNENNAKLADLVGEILGSPDNVWIGWLLVGLGNGEDLTVPFIANLVVNTTSKANTNSTNQSKIKSTVGGNNHNNKVEDVIIDKDSITDEDFNDYSGNVGNSVAQSSLIQASAGDILTALNQSNILVPTIMKITENQNLGTLVKTLVSRIYASGLINDLPLDTYYEYAKKENILSDALQYILTDPTWSPGLATFFKRMDDAGAYQRLQDNMYGIKK